MSGERGKSGDELLDSQAIEESLNEALNDLEHMLERHEGSRGSTHQGPEQEVNDEGPYTIPLLDDVVVPGIPAAAPQAPEPTQEPEPATEHDDEAALRRRLAARLASEVEVIVQDRIEAAVEDARAEICERVRNHMDIVLPEIVEEILALRKRRER